MRAVWRCVQPANLCCRHGLRPHSSFCPPPSLPAETQMQMRDAAELVADKKPAYLSLKAGDKGAHFMLIEMKQAR